MPASNRHQLPVHPLIAASAPSKAGEPTEQPVKLMGYVGESSRANTVRLYSTLKDLSFYIEFPESAVVHTAEVPENQLPDRAISVWLKRDTPVHWIREYQSVPELTNSIRVSLRRRAVPLRRR
jgi:hypothetical protein